MSSNIHIDQTNQESSYPALELRPVSGASTGQDYDFYEVVNNTNWKTNANNKLNVTNNVWDDVDANQHPGYFYVNNSTAKPAFSNASTGPVTVQATHPYVHIWKVSDQKYMGYFNGWTGQAVAWSQLTEPRQLQVVFTPPTTSRYEFVEISSGTDIVHHLTPQFTGGQQQTVSFIVDTDVLVNSEWQVRTAYAANGSGRLTGSTAGSGFNLLPSTGAVTAAQADVNGNLTYVLQSTYNMQNNNSSTDDWRVVAKDTVTNAETYSNGQALVVGSNSITFQAFASTDYNAKHIRLQLRGVLQGVCLKS